MLSKYSTLLVPTRLSCTSLVQIDPNEGIKKGNVELWLSDVEKAMCACLRESFSHCLATYAEVPRIEWLGNWPGQVAVAGSQVMWTSEVEQCLVAKGGKGDLAAYKLKLDDQLSDIVIMLRGDGLGSRFRKTVSALVTIDVHQVCQIRAEVQPCSCCAAVELCGRAALQHCS